MKFKKGDRVVFTSGYLHRLAPNALPEKGTAGTVTEVDAAGFITVRWDHGPQKWNESLIEAEHLKEAE